jgi:hypothetical protein
MNHCGVVEVEGWPLVLYKEGRGYGWLLQIH